MSSVDRREGSRMDIQRIRRDRTGSQKLTSTLKAVDFMPVDTSVSSSSVVHAKRPELQPPIETEQPGPLSVVPMVMTTAGGVSDGRLQEQPSESVAECFTHPRQSAVAAAADRRRWQPQQIGGGGSRSRSEASDRRPE